MAVEAYRDERLSDAQFRRLLGLDRFQADELLKTHGVWLSYSIDDFEREGAANRKVRDHAQR
jgi:hypothetical protein